MHHPQARLPTLCSEVCKRVPPSRLKTELYTGYRQLFAITARIRLATMFLIDENLDHHRLTNKKKTRSLMFGLNPQLWTRYRLNDMAVGSG
jgi:hypothetical protein